MIHAGTHPPPAGQPTIHADGIDRMSRVIHFSSRVKSSPRRAGASPVTCCYRMLLVHCRFDAFSSQLRRYSRRARPRGTRTRKQGAALDKQVYYWPAISNDGAKRGARLCGADDSVEHRDIKQEGPSQPLVDENEASPNVPNLLKIYFVKAC